MTFTFTYAAVLKQLGKLQPLMPTRKNHALLEWSDLTVSWFTNSQEIRCHAIYTHTHPFNGPLSGTTQVSRYQKGKTNLDFTEARDCERQWHQLGQCKSAPRSRQITMPAPHHSVFYRPDALPAAQPTASKHWRHMPCHLCTIFRKMLIMRYDTYN